MIKGKLLIILFVSFIASTWSQERVSAVSYRVGFTKSDFLTGFEYGRFYDRWNPSAALDIGVYRAVLQKRFFPKLTIGSSYNLINRDKIKLGPSLNYSYSLLKVNASSSHFHTYHELLGGAKFKVGAKWYFQMYIEAGYYGERYYNQVELRKNTVHSFGYRSSIGLGYAW